MATTIINPFFFACRSHILLYIFLTLIDRLTSSSILPQRYYCKTFERIFCKSPVQSSEINPNKMTSRFFNLLFCLVLCLVLISSARAFKMRGVTFVSTKANSHKPTPQTLIISLTRGGSDNSVYDEEDEDSDEAEDEDEEVDDGDDDKDVEEANEEWDDDQYDRETISDVIVDEIEEELFEEQEEELLVEAIEEVFDDEDGEDEEFHDAMEELPAADDEESAPLTRVLEDESSAFVDRMDLADAYDEGETTTNPDEASALAAASAAKVSAGGGGDDDDDQVKIEEKAATEAAILTEITNDMKKILRNDLKYTGREVKLMRPDIAAMILAKNVRRPIEGMPANFYVEGKAPSQSRSVRRAIMKVSLTLAAVGAVAVLGLNGDIDDFVKSAAKPFALVATIPSRLMQSNTSKTPVRAAAVEPVQSIPIDQPIGDEPSGPGEVEGKEDESHPHSVKPYADHAPAYEEDLDKTWLDKAISKVENVVKAFFRITI